MRSVIEIEDLGSDIFLLAICGVLKAKSNDEYIQCVPAYIM